MIVKPSVQELLTKSKNRYELVIAASKRARQIANGDEALTDVNERSVVTLAANEIAEGKVKIIGEDNQNEKEMKNETNQKEEETENVENKEEE